MSRSLATLFAGVELVCRLILVLLTLTVLLTVFGRYGFDHTPRWSEELALTALVWLSLLSVALGVRGGWHIRLDLALRALPARPRAGTELLNTALAALTAGLFLWYGWKLTMLNVSSLMPGLGVSAAWRYAAAPIAGALILLALAERTAFGPKDRRDD